MLGAVPPAEKGRVWGRHAPDGSASPRVGAGTAEQAVESPRVCDRQRAVPRPSSCPQRGWGVSGQKPPPVAPVAFRGPACRQRPGAHFPARWGKHPCPQPVWRRVWGGDPSRWRPRPAHRPAHRPAVPPDPETPLDCEVSLWSSWGLCAGACGRPGAKSRTRYVRVRPANHGAPCPPLEEEAPCDPDNCV